MIVGPEVGDWLAARLSLSRAFALLWPSLHWTLAMGLAVVAVQTVYFLAPNVKQRFPATLPGAVLSVVCWMGAIVLAPNIFPIFWKLQPNLRNPSRGNGAPDLALLGLFHFISRG